MCQVHDLAASARREWVRDDNALVLEVKAAISTCSERGSYSDELEIAFLGALGQKLLGVGR
jgi:hypothetical protein